MDDMMAEMSAPTSETAPPSAKAAPGATAPSHIVGRPGPVDVSEQQRGYLDELAQVGVHPSSDLVALSIGTYVCQARAANQSDQEVWDFVIPLVRTDVRNSHLNPPQRADAPPPLRVDTPPTRGTGPPAAVGDAPPSEVAATAADYIRVATERLC
jgi:hypothetical protein